MEVRLNSNVKRFEKDLKKLEKTCNEKDCAVIVQITSAVRKEKRRPMKIVFVCYRIVRTFFEKDLPVFAASAAFWIMISAVPLLMSVLTAVQLIPGFDESRVQDLLIQAAPNMPQFSALIHFITDSLFVSEPGTILSLSAVMTLWPASTGVYGIEKGIHRICGSDRKSHYLTERVFAMFLTVFFIAVLILTLFILVLGDSIQLLVSAHAPLLARLIDPFLDKKTLISAGFLFCFFLLFYRVLPGGTSKRDLNLHGRDAGTAEAACLKEIKSGAGKFNNRKFNAEKSGFDTFKTRKIFPGALFATAGWIIFSGLFSIYFTHYRNISYMYGSLGALVLFMFWLYAVICIVFLGAVLNCCLADGKEPDLKQTA